MKQSNLYMSYHKSNFKRKVYIHSVDSTNMKHPDPKIQETQETFLNQCLDNEKAYYARHFRIGNAAYLYYQHANRHLNSLREDDIMKLYYQEWLHGLPAQISSNMKARGFEGCKSTLSFRRYVNERDDVGMDERTFIQRGL